MAGTIVHLSRRLCGAFTSRRLDGSTATYYNGWYGFVRPDAATLDAEGICRDDLFLHPSDAADDYNPAVGDRVTFRRGTHNGRAKAVEVRLIMDPARRMVPHEPAVAPCWAAPARAVSPDYRQAPAIRGENRHVSLGPRGSPQTYPQHAYAPQRGGRTSRRISGTAPSGAAAHWPGAPKHALQEEDSKLSARVQPCRLRLGPWRPGRCWTPTVEKRLGFAAHRRREPGDRREARYFALATFRVRGKNSNHGLARRLPTTPRGQHTTPRGRSHRARRRGAPHHWSSHKSDTGTPAPPCASVLKEPLLVIVSRLRPCSRAAT